MIIGLLKKRDQKEKDCVEKCMDIDTVNEATSKGCQEDCYLIGIPFQQLNTKLKPYYLHQWAHVTK